MKKIRATICVELPYDNELLCFNDKLNHAILEVLKHGQFGCTVETGDNLPENIGVPINAA